MCSSEQGFHWNRTRQDYRCLLTANSASPSSSVLLSPDNLFSLIWFTHWFCVTFPPPLLTTPSGIFSGRDGDLVPSLVACSAAALSSIPGLGRSPGGGHGNPLQYACLEGMNRGLWWATVHGVEKSWIRPSDKAQHRHGNKGKSDRLSFLGLQKHCRWWLQPWN